MPTPTRAQTVAQQLRDVERTYLDKHAAAHAQFRAAYAEALERHGLSVAAHADFHDLPAELHEELAPHKEALVAALAQANDDKHSAASVVRPRLNIVRAVKATRQ